jgi:hypothetical protein
MINSRFKKSNSIKEAINILGKEAIDLSQDEIDNLLKLMNQRFVKDLKFPLWEGIIDSVSVIDLKGWQTIRSFVSKKETILFLDPNQERFAIRVKDGSDIVDILNECEYMVFYLTNPDFDFLLCFNDHDYLIAKGEIAETWIESNYSV